MLDSSFNESSDRNIKHGIFEYNVGSMFKDSGYFEDYI